MVELRGRKMLTLDHVANPVARAAAKRWAKAA
jgi:hypothetical protein